MRLTVLGCSGSVPGPDSCASGYLVEVPGTAPIVVDLGPGTLGRLQRYADPSSVMVLLSHLHADHCLDVPGLLVWRRYGPATGGYAVAPLFGPSGTAFRIGVASAEESGVVDDISDTFALTTWTDGGVVELPRLDAGAEPVVVRTVRVDHPPEAYALRLTDPGGRTLVYSGDTAFTDRLVDLAAGANVLLCEASWEDRPDHPSGVHMSGREAGRTAALAGVGTLVLTHIPPWTDTNAVLAEASAEFDGPIIVAAPDMVLDI